MNKILATALLSSLVTTFDAQNTNIIWGKVETIDYGIEQRTYPKFENKGYSVDADNVFITTSQKSNGNKYKISNPIWQKVNKKELYDIDILTLPEEDFFDIFYHFDKKKNEEYLTAKLATFKRIKGEIFRLESFNIELENSMLQEGIKRKRNAQKRLGTEENPLQSGNFYKIKIDKSGIFKITKKFLQDNAINPNNINPKHFRIYGNGGVMLPEFNQDERFLSLQENAIQVVGEDDGRWDDEDYALFYAQGPNGFNLYNSDISSDQNRRTETRQDKPLHLQNIYEDYSYYYINFDKGIGKRVESRAVEVPQNLITRYDDYQFVNEEKFNLMKIGRIWVGDAFSKDKSLIFNTKSAIREDDNIYYRISVVGDKCQGNSVEFSLNGKNNETINIDTRASDFSQIRNFNRITKGLSGNTITLNMKPFLSANPDGNFYFDYAEIVYKEDLKFNGSQMNFRDFSIRENSGKLYGFSIDNASELEQVWNISDITNAVKMVNQSGVQTKFNFGYRADSESFNNEFVAFKHSEAYTPIFVEHIENQDLHSLENIDYLIITKNEMFSEAKRLAQYHEDKNNFRTAVVDIKKIYNEFSSGSQDITAIRDFISYLNNERGGLKYVLIIGDTSYDFKHRISPNDNIVPSYQSENSGSFISSYVTDDYFVMTKPQSSRYITFVLPDVPVGRLPASNVSEARILIDKTLAYYNALPKQSSPFGEWRMKLDFVVDDDTEGGPFHNMMNEVIKHNFENTSERQEYNIRKLYFDASPSESSPGGQRYPYINQAISSDMNNSLYMFYFGHGGINGWAQERVLTSDEIRNFNNFNSAYTRFPLVSTITCEFTLWDTPDVSSAGEQVIKHKNGGAATMITSSRALSVSYGRNFTDIFTESLFSLEDNDFNTLGNAHLMAKQGFGMHPDHLRVNFLGDPAMKLSRPKPLLKIEKIETPINGQLRALDFVKISGFVSNEDGSINENFNGRVSFSIFDKKNNKTTLNNDNKQDLEPKLSYKEEGNAVVKASGKAINGKFEVEFYMPKEINYNIGEGRIFGYADNFETAKSDAYDVYSNETIKIGDINPNGINDNEPPKIKLYMNNTNFVDGGITNQHPNLLACVTDDIGINTTGVGIGHDITVVLDGEVVNTIQLNDFYTSGESNGCINASLSEYQKGSVLYPFRNLKEGEHQLVFKIWDINNNSSTASLNFIVQDESSQKLQLNRLLNWPNPFTDKTYIQFEHNCNDALDVNVQIYTITGKLVRSFSQSIFAEPYLEGFRTPKMAIEWDGRDDFGALVGKGTYIYKILARSQNQEQCKGSATAIEKMVILK